jgi:alanyl-tRNA synthetase
LQVPPDEFRLPFFHENGFVRKLCPSCGNYYWTLDSDAENCGDAPCVDYSFIGRSPVKRRYTFPEMREKFLSFFEERSHKRIAPYPVVARWRDDLMFTIASIIDFQPYVTEGILPPPANPLVVSQPCLRFEDIDLVGVTAGRHMSIFEMGGHHAFNYQGQREVYWKDETVRYHHELLTRDLGVPEETVTYKEGLWSGGGNAGYDLEGSVNGLEISTLVFMMFRVVGDRMEPMPVRVVDTGYGMERWAWLSQGTPSAIHAIYGPLLKKTFAWAGLKPDETLLAKMAERSYLIDMNNKVEERARRAKEIGYNPDEVEVVLNQVEGIYAALDHTKAMVFILSEGIVPSNVKEGYLVRMLFRRGYRLLRRAGIEGRLPDLVDAQIGYWGGDFPQLREMRDEIMEMVAVEGEKYRETLSRGSDLVRRSLGKGSGSVPVDQLVDFYDSHGLTPEDVGEVASEMGREVKVPSDFYTLVSRKHMKAQPKAEDPTQAKLAHRVEKMEKTRRLFYEDPYLREFDAVIVEVVDGRLVLDQTAFYAEGGGQISDLGKITSGGKTYDVEDVQSIEGVLLHRVKQRGFKRGAKVHGVIDWERRSALMRAHTATHIIIGSARRVLGEHAWQAGASKGVERSRIDISHYARLMREQVEEIEQLANMVIREGRPVTCRFMQRDQAEAMYGFRLYQGGAVPGKEIRVVEIGGWDVEACGGTHLSNTSEAGLIKIVATERVQDGVERITFSVGPYALEEVQRREALLQDAAELLGSPIDKIKESIANSLASVKQLRDQLEALRLAASREKAAQLLREAEEVKGVKLVVYSDKAATDYLIEVGNALSEASGLFVAAMFSETEGRIAVKVGDGALKRGVHAGRLVQEIAKVIGGGGGGQPYFAQGGGGDPGKFKASRKSIRDAVAAQLR